MKKKPSPETLEQALALIAKLEKKITTLKKSNEHYRLMWIDTERNLDDAKSKANFWLDQATKHAKSETEYIKKYFELEDKLLMQQLDKIKSLTTGLKSPQGDYDLLWQTGPCKGGEIDTELGKIKLEKVKKGFKWVHSELHEDIQLLFDAHLN